MAKKKITVQLSEKRWMKLRLAVYQRMEELRSMVEENSDPTPEGARFLDKTERELDKLLTKLEDYE